MITKELPICVIEDNAPIRKLFCVLLGKNGYKTVDFGDGLSGCAWIKENKVMAVITDILLPDINGAEVLNSIRSLEKGNDICVIAVTGFAQANDKDKYINMGFDSYISKPVNTGTFVSEVEAIIKEKYESIA